MHSIYVREVTHMFWEEGGKAYHYVILTGYRIPKTEDYIQFIASPMEVSALKGKRDDKDRKTRDIGERDSFNS